MSLPLFCSLVVLLMTYTAVILATGPGKRGTSTVPLHLLILRYKKKKKPLTKQKQTGQSPSIEVAELLPAEMTVFPPGDRAQLLLSYQ